MTYLPALCMIETRQKTMIFQMIGFHAMLCNHLASWSSIMSFQVCRIIALRSHSQFKSKPSRWVIKLSSFTSHVTNIGQKMRDFQRSTVFLSFGPLSSCMYQTFFFDSAVKDAWMLPFFASGTHKYVNCQTTGPSSPVMTSSSSPRSQAEKGLPYCPYLRSLLNHLMNLGLSVYKARTLSQSYSTHLPMCHWRMVKNFSSNI